MKNSQTKKSKPEFTLDTIDATLTKLLAIRIYDWERFYDDMAQIDAPEEILKVMYLLMVLEQLLPEDQCSLLPLILVRWAFTEKRLGKEDWISYEDIFGYDDEDDEDDLNVAYIGARPNKYIDKLRAICNSRKEE